MKALAKTMMHNRRALADKAMRAAITARLKAGKDLVSPVCIYSIAEAHVAVDRPQQCADVGGLGDGGEVLDLGRSDCAAQDGCDVLVASNRRHPIEEHPAEHAPTAPGDIISPGGLDYAKAGQRHVRLDLCARDVPAPRKGL